MYGTDLLILCLVDFFTITLTGFVIWWVTRK